MRKPSCIDKLTFHTTMYFLRREVWSLGGGGILRIDKLT